ncbi:hypothetical protein K458DRAFT_450385 [Lentithecium fluviatile CBS 122367]|uniref:Uncharacterized protein n=1 Tax=Lentithecium fluviatile CBS 122367 TaxID=1168545 RepID=A0A6G1J5A2_9PLEO|nr:hypothetical protein K458DRAFT_450385 [Lentithecium fluviatile CBS 122367]
MQAGPRLFALRPSDREIADLMRDPTVQACSLPTGRILYFALPTPGKVLTWLDPSELLHLYRHLEGALGLLSRVGNPGTIDYLATFMNSILNRLSRAGLPAPIPNYLPVSLAGIAVGDPDIVSWINNGFQGHPPKPYQHFPSLPHPLVCHINAETGDFELRMTTPECLNYWDTVNKILSQGHKAFFHRVADMIHDPSGEHIYAFVPGPFHADRDPFYAWKEHHCYITSDRAALERAFPMSKPSPPVPNEGDASPEKHRQDRQKKRARSDDAHKRSKSPERDERRPARNAKCSRSLEPQQSTRRVTRHETSPPNSRKKDFPAPPEGLEEVFNSLTDEESEAIYSLRASIRVNADNTCQLVCYTHARTAESGRALEEPEGSGGLCDRCPEERMQHQAQPSRRANGPQDDGAIPKHVDTEFNNETEESDISVFARLNAQEELDSMIVRQNRTYSVFLSSLERFSEWANDLGYRLGDENMRELMLGGRTLDGFTNWLYSANSNIDELYQCMLRFDITKGSAHARIFYPRQDYLEDMNNWELFLYCRGLFEVVQEYIPRGTRAFHIYCPLVPGVTFKADVWRNIIGWCQQQDYRAFFYMGGELEQFYASCVTDLLNFNTSINQTNSTKTGLDSRTKPDGKWPEDSWTAPSDFLPWAPSDSSSFPERSVSPKQKKHPSNQNRTKRCDHPKQTPLTTNEETSLTTFVETLTRYELSLVTKGIMAPVPDDSELGWHLAPASRLPSPPRNTQKVPSPSSVAPKVQAKELKQGGKDRSAKQVNEKTAQPCGKKTSRQPSQESSQKSSKAAGKQPVPHEFSDQEHITYEDLLGLDIERLHYRYRELASQPPTPPSDLVTPLLTPPPRRGYRSPPTSRHRPQRTSSVRSVSPELGESDWTYISDGQVFEEPKLKYRYREI